MSYIRSSFVDFTAAELQKFKDVFGAKAKYKSDSVIIKDFKLVKLFNGHIYFELDENEQVLVDEGDYVNMVGPLRWAKINHMDKLFEDFKKGKLKEYNEYM